MTHQHLVGHCTQCDTHLWDLEQARANRSGHKATFMLSDGSIMDLTMCEGCVEEPDFDALWGVTMHSWLHEPRYFADSPAVRDEQAFQRAQKGTFILALLYTDVWWDIEMRAGF